MGDRAEVERWNRILTAATPRFNIAPNAFLVAMTKGVKPGRSLDVGTSVGDFGLEETRVVRLAAIKPE